MSNPYIDLANAEEGSVEHLAAVEAIRALEVAEAKSQENVIKGDGRSGHSYASYTVTPSDAVPGYEFRTPGGMTVGEGFTDYGDTVRIGDMRTSRDVAEAMRRTMDPVEWEALTGLPYQSLTQNPQFVQDQMNKPKERFPHKSDDPIQQALDKALELEKLEGEEADSERQADELSVEATPPSPLESVIAQAYGQDMLDKITRHTVETGELEPEHLAQLGASPEMVEDTVKHYEELTDRMLQPVGSCSAYMLNFLDEREASAARAAIVSKNVGEVRRLGELARDRAASMSHDQVKDFLSAAEAKQLRLRTVNRQVVVDLPQVGTVAWGTAVTNGWISFG